MATDLERLVVQLSADFKSFERSMARADGITNKQFNAIEARARKLNTNLNNIGRSAAQGLIAPLTGLGAALGVREIANYADAWTEAGNKIRAAATSAGVSARSLDLLKDGANDARTDLASYVDLYARLIRSASGVAKSEQQIADATNIVSKAFKAGGASASEQAAGILQLGQALGSGVLQGDELRSLRENAPILAQAIADEFKTTIAGLKKLGAEGKLTSDRVFKAIISAQKPIEAQFRATNSTIRDGITRLNNEFTAYIGHADTGVGATKALVDALQFLSDNFTEVADVVVQFATILASALAGRAILGVVAGLGNAVIALGSFLSALRAGTIAATGFTAALGPIGLLAGAAAGALVLFYNSQDSAESSASSFKKAINENEGALRDATSATYAQIDALKQLIATQAKAARAKAIEANADYTTAESRATGFRKATGYNFAPLDFAANQALDKADALDLAAGKLEDQLLKVNEIAATKPSSFGNGTTLPDDGDGKKKKKTRENEFQRELKSISDRTAAMVAETEAQRQINPLINDYGYAIEKARAQQDLLNAAQEAGVKITPELRAQIGATAEQFAIATVEAGKLAEAQDKVREKAEEMADFQKDLARGMVDGFLNGASAAEILADSLTKVGNKLLDMAFDGLFNTKSSGGSGFNPLGFLADMFRETGGPVKKGQPYIVGEKRPELFVPNQNGKIVPRVPNASALQAPTMPRLQAQSASSQGASTFTFAPQIDNRGASVEAVARLEQVVAKQQREFEARAVNAVRKAQKGNVKLS